MWRALARWAGLCALAGVLLVALVAALAHRADGPFGPFPGGPLTGEIASGESALFGDGEGGLVELEVNPAAPRSITVWGLAHAGSLYVPAMFARRKAWPQQVLRDPRVVVRWRGRLHLRTAVRVRDRAELAALHAAITALETRSSPETLASDGTWYFRLEPRSR